MSSLQKGPQHHQCGSDRNSTRLLPEAQHEHEDDLGVCSGSVGVAAVLRLRLGVAPVAAAIAAGRRVLRRAIAAAPAVAGAATCRVCAQSGARTLCRACSRTHFFQHMQICSSTALEAENLQTLPHQLLNRS